ncbi:MAG: MFS transporter [Candidatus Lindowbacteria bacterium]|nr:MFS transporter [Candidatus Lindowbacteria bacterium]
MTTTETLSPNTATNRNSSTIKTMFLVGAAWFGMNAFFAFDLASMPLFFNDRIEQKWVVGLILGMMGGFGILVAPLFGLISDRIRHRLGRRRPMMLIGLPLFITLLIVTQYMHTIWLMAIIWPFVYLFHLVVERPWGALMPDLFPPDKRATANGVSQLLGASASLLYFVLGRYLWARNEELTFYVVAAVYAAGILALVFGIKENPTDMNESKVEGGRSKVERIGEKGKRLNYITGLLEHRDLLKYTLACLFWSMGLNGVLPWLTSFGTEDLGMSVELSFLPLALSVVVIIIFSVPFGILADRIGHKALTSIGLLIMVLVNICVVFVHSIPLVFVLMGIVAFGFCIIVVVPYALMVNLIPEDRMAELIGISSISVYVSILIGKPLSGFLIDAFGSYRPIFIFAAVNHALGLLFLQGVKEKKHGAA